MLQINGLKGVSIQAGPESGESNKDYLTIKDGIIDCNENKLRGIKKPETDSDAINKNI